METFGEIGPWLAGKSVEIECRSQSVLVEEGIEVVAVVAHVDESRGHSRGSDNGSLWVRGHFWFIFRDEIFRDDISPLAFGAGPAGAGCVKKVRKAWRLDSSLCCSANI